MAKAENKPFVLAGDIGGTKTNVGLFQMGKRRPILKQFATFSSREAANLEDIIQQFKNKGRFTDMLGKIPVKAILNERAALTGAAMYAFKMLNRQWREPKEGGKW